MNEVNNNQLINNELDNQTISQDEELLKIFVGKNYESIKQQKFNPSAFFLTTPYLFYRKKYLWGFIYMVLSVVAELLITNSSMAICLLIGLFFNKYYLKDSIKKIEKIKTENMGSSPDTLKQIIATKGGTSLASAIILTLVLFFVIVGTVIGLVFAIVMPIVEQSMNFDYDTNINIKDKFVFENEMDFDDETNENRYLYDYEPLIEEYDSCSIYLHKIKNYDSVEKFINDNADEEYKTNPLRKNANNIEWVGYINSSLITDFYIYATEIDGEVYILEYDTFGVAKTGPCHEYKDKVFDYIKINENNTNMPNEETITPSDDIIMQY